MRKKKEINYYNEDVKQWYLEEKSRIVNIPMQYFECQLKWVSEFEHELEKDVSNWNIYEIMDFYKALNVSGYETLLCLNSTLFQYTQFCLKNNLVKDGQNHFLECTREMMLNCINKAVFLKKIVTREQIIEWVDQLPNARDQYILLSLFEYGKSKDFKDIVYAEWGDVDKDNKTLKLQNRTVNISTKLISVIEECKLQENYYSMSGKGVRWAPLDDYGYIVKSNCNQRIDSSDFQKGRVIYLACNRIFDFLGVKGLMSANAISDSGKLHMIKERADFYNVTPYEYIQSKNIDEVGVQFGCRINSSIYKEKYGEYLA